MALLLSACSSGRDDLADNGLGGANSHPPGTATIEFGIGGTTTTDAAPGARPRPIVKGTTVAWLNEGIEADSVISDDGLFDSGPIAPGGQFRFTFNETGTFEYHFGNSGDEAAIEVFNPL